MRRIVPAPARRVLRSAVLALDDLRDQRAFLRDHPDLGHRIERDVTGARIELGEGYAGYVGAVSSPVAAVSLETAALLRVICEVLEVDTALDLGSGFSTWVLAGSARVTSVDDSDVWRAATERYLGPMGGEVDLVGLDRVSGVSSAFDLVFHDLGSMATRAAWLPWALDRATKACVLDDVHKAPYRALVEQELAGRRGTLWKAGRLTRDSFGRHCWVWFPEGHAETRSPTEVRP